MTTSLSKIISPGLYDVHRAIRQGGVNEVVLPGGRGSTKSSFASVELILLLLRHPDCHAVVLRKVANTLRNSVYEQVVWAISELGLKSRFELAVSPMRVIYKPTGQRIMFFGLDDPGKIKSIKVPFGYVGLVWFEELDQYSGLEEIRSAEQSLFRGGSFSFAIKSFNPPAMARNWANKYALEQRPGKLVYRSDYRSVPPHWLGPRFLADAEHLQATNETAYRHEYLGEVVGSGTQVFENLNLTAITDEEIARMERLYHGVDWGWYPDPWAFNSCGYDAARKVLYIWDESTRRRTSNADTAQILLDKGVCQEDGREEYLTADSAEEKSCGDYRALGLPCRGAEKGPGSVKAGMKWLQSLAEIRIDPARCPDTAKEFSEYEYEKDKKTGEVLEGYPDLDNHHIDAVRYAMSRIWKRRGA